VREVRLCRTRLMAHLSFGHPPPLHSPYAHTRMLAPLLTRPRGKSSDMRGEMRHSAHPQGRARWSAPVGFSRRTWPGMALPATTALCHFRHGQPPPLSAVSITASHHRSLPFPPRRPATTSLCRLHHGQPPPLSAVSTTASHRCMAMQQTYTTTTTTTTTPSLRPSDPSLPLSLSSLKGSLLCSRHPAERSGRSCQAAHPERPAGKSVDMG
jgi:hypothetical protein